MLFNSIPYLLFLPLVFAAYWLSPAKFRRVLLLLASYVFYMSWIPVYGCLIFALTVGNYIAGRVISHQKRGKKAIFAFAVAGNLLTLSYYKYANFLINSATSLINQAQSLVHIGTALQPSALSVILPLGISFFAFEFIHYLTDVYKGGQPIRNPIDFGLFAAFFPSQIAGPIKRYQDFTQQLANLPGFKSVHFDEGFRLIVQGLFKKVALSDNISGIVSAGFNQAGNLSTVDAWIATLGFALQIYFDFSGYTDIGRGSALLLGFKLPDNFNLPYIASSLSDFWKRWHISLSSWLRDYLYIPLGGGRTTRFRKHLNLMITMLLGGLWHGAAWHYVVWGGFHGAGLVLNHEYDAIVARTPLLRSFHNTQAGRVLSALATFMLVLIGWVLFRATTLGEAKQLLSRMIIFHPGTSFLSIAMDQSPVMVALCAYAIYGLVASGIKRLSDNGTVLPAPLQLAWPSRAVIYLGAFVAAIGFAPQGASPFIYFQF